MNDLMTSSSDVQTYQLQNTCIIILAILLGNETIIDQPEQTPVGMYDLGFYCRTDIDQPDILLFLS